MISYIKGQLIYQNIDGIVVENNGIGYKILMPSLQINKYNIGDKVKVFTYMYVREDALTLYGFYEENELNIFKKLITVTGIGPKGAIGMLSQLTPNDIILSIVNKDTKTLCKAPGIGEKTAQRILLELKDKIKVEQALLINNDKNIQTQIQNNQTKDEVILALQALGYSKSVALQALNKVITESNSSDVTVLIKESLKWLAAN